MDIQYNEVNTLVTSERITSKRVLTKREMTTMTPRQHYLKYLRGVLDQFINKHARIRDVSFDILTVCLLAVIFELLSLSVLSRIQQIIARLAKAHHFSKDSRGNKTKMNEATLVIRSTNNLQPKSIQDFADSGFLMNKQASPNSS